MLTGISLENIALMERLDLDFSSGLTVLTGETGAGKSILLDALDALLGGAQGSQGSRLLRQGCSTARIEARFRLSEAVRRWLLSHSLEADEGEVVLSRDWRRQDGRVSSRCRLNGVAVNRSQVLELRPLLLDLTVQGQTQQLARPGQQCRWLDRFAGEGQPLLLEDSRRAFRRWREAAAALTSARADRERLARDSQRQSELLADLEAAGLEDPGESRRLQIEQDRLAHGVHLQEGVMELLGRLVEGSGEAPSALDHLGACGQRLQQMEGMDPSLETLRQACMSALVGLQDLARDLERYGAGLESDPQALDSLQGRMAQLKALERRHGLSLGELIAERDRLREWLCRDGGAASLAHLERHESEARRDCDGIQRRLSEARMAAAGRLEKQLLEALRPMGLAHVRFAVAITPVDPTEEGADRVQFQFSANPGQPLAPLAEVASGGEMSRFLLALKTSLAVADSDITLLFDEIDAGVSGRVSGAMATLLAQLARRRQVFCITHQPLVAAAADHHFRVSKVIEAGVTRTRVSHLRDIGARQGELAELAGGDSGEARSYAASLLEKGGRAA